MKTVKNFLISALLLSLIFFNACKKDTTTTNSNPANYLAPSLVKDTLINLPAAISTKEQADFSLPYPADSLGTILFNLVYDAEIVNVYSTYLSSAFWITPAELSYYPGYKATKNSDGSTTYSYTLSAYGISEGVALTYYNSSGDSWWKYSIDSASYSKEYYYVDDKGTSGTIDWFNTSTIKSLSNVLSLSDSWSISGSTTNSTFSFYNTDGTLNQKFVSTSTTSKSGTLLVTGQNNNTGPLVNQWSFTWTGAGTGSYIEYGTDGVSIISQGNF